MFIYQGPPVEIVQISCPCLETKRVQLSIPFAEHLSFNKIAEEALEFEVSFVDEDLVGPLTLIVPSSQKVTLFEFEFRPSVVGNRSGRFVVS